MYTWGHGKDGQLGVNSNLDMDRPVVVEDLKENGVKVVSIACAKPLGTFCGPPSPPLMAVAKPNSRADGGRSSPAFPFSPCPHSSFSNATQFNWRAHERKCTPHLRQHHHGRMPSGTGAAPTRASTVNYVGAVCRCGT
eukprot:SAG11_NODE_8047_length_1065_cov_1.262940_1_plen_137_part_01